MLKSEIDKSKTLISCDYRDSQEMRELAKKTAGLQKHLPLKVRQEINYLESIVITTPLETYGEIWEKFNLLPPAVVQQCLADENIVPDGYEKSDDSNERRFFPVYEHGRLVHYAIEKGLIVKEIRQREEEVVHRRVVHEECYVVPTEKSSEEHEIRSEASPDPVISGGEDEQAELSSDSVTQNSGDENEAA